MAELVSDELWKQIEPLLPPSSPQGGRPPVEHRERADRDRVCSQDLSVNLEVMWKTVNEDLPPLEPVIRQIIADMHQP